MGQERSCSPEDRLALTIHPEWVWAILRLGKRVENRTWDAPGLVGKWLAIHGGGAIGGRPIPKRGPSEFHRACIQSVATMAARGSGIVLSAGELQAAPAHILQEARGIVAICQVAGFVRGEDAGWYIGAPSIGWQLRRVIRLPQPIACPGQQGLWKLSPEIVAAIRLQLQQKGGDAHGTREPRRDSGREPSARPEEPGSSLDGLQVTAAPAGEAGAAMTEGSP